MRWQLKAALMDFLSVWPGGDRLHYWTQRKVTKSLPRKESELEEKFKFAKEHLEAVSRNRRKTISDLQFYEFGAGWDLAIPFCFYALGVRSQILVDICKLARVDLVIDAFQRVSRLRGGTAIETRLRENGGAAWSSSLEKQYGIRYLAPCDARSTGLSSECVDSVTSTDTLEHIPEDDIRLILKECKRILRKDGVLSFMIDYQDHYFYCDPRITAYNFLRYSPNRWKWFSPRLHYQNRLRHKDYIRLAEEQGFELVEDRHSQVLPRDLSDLEQMRVAPSFSESYRLEELAVRRGHLVFRQASA